MRIKPGFELQNVCGESVVVAMTPELIDFSEILALNETAAYLWTSVKNIDFGLSTLVNLLCSRYDVNPEIASQDAAQIIEIWKREGVLDT